MKLCANKMIVLPALLVLMTSGLGACVSGAITHENMRVKPSSDFLDQLIDEQPAVDECCPATGRVVDDWIADNEPDY